MEHLTSLDLLNNNVALGALAASVAVAGVAVAAKSKKEQYPPPPGPPPKLVIGNLTDMPTEFEWLTFTKWGKEYGPVNSINIFGQMIVVLQTQEMSKKLLETRSATASSRPHFPMAGDLVGWGQSLAMLPYGPRLRETRKMLHNKLIGQRNVSQYRHLNIRESTRLLLKAIARPDQLESHVRHLAGAVILEITYGYEVKEKDDELVHIAQIGVDNFSLSSAPGAFMVDLMPALKYVPAWFPGANFKQMAAKWSEERRKVFDVPFEMVKNEMKQGKGKSSFTRDLLEEAHGDPNAEDVIKWAAGSMYAGGADTTVSSIRTFFMVMALHPELQSKLQADIDAVTHGTRLPTFDDRDQLPIIDATVKELLRIYAIGPIGLPHRMTETEIFEGYTIPKGALVFANIWGMNHDEAVYPEADKFKPERFLNKGAAHGPGVSPANFESFGFGRRTCPGRDLADNSLWITIALTLATVTVSNVRDLEGKPITMENVKYTPGIISHPQAYNIDITPRSAQAHELLKASAMFTSEH